MGLARDSVLEKELVFLLESTFKCFVLWVGCEIVVLLSMVPHFLSMWKCRSIFWDLNVLFNLLFWTIGRKNAVDGKFVFYGYPETICASPLKKPTGVRIWVPLHLTSHICTSQIFLLAAILEGIDIEVFWVGFVFVS